MGIVVGKSWEIFSSLSGDAGNLNDLEEGNLRDFDDLRCLVGDVSISRDLIGDVPTDFRGEIPKDLIPQALDSRDFIGDVATDFKGEGDRWDEKDLRGEGEEKEVRGREEDFSGVEEVRRGADLD